MLKNAVKKLMGSRMLDVCLFLKKTCTDRFDLDHAQRIMERLPLVLRPALKSFITYRYRVEITNAKRVSEHISMWRYSIRTAFIAPKTMLFYPDAPKPFHAMYKLLTYLGYYITSDRRKDCNPCMLWWLAFDGNPFAPEQSLSVLENVKRNGNTVLNRHGRDISKVAVNSTFEKVFGYSLSVDPRVYTGKCVMKLNWNALHQGKIVHCPSEPDDGDVVYQRLIRNEVENGLIEDMRVPVFGDKIPFVYLKYRLIENRMVDRAHTAYKAVIAETSTVLSAEEQKNICGFARQMGLDYCEVDVLRDRQDGRIYIVDANNTPSGPPSPISMDDEKIAVARLSEAFQEAFEHVPLFP